MPQLDKVTFVSQVFWLIVFFITFYVIILRFILPEIAIILKIRKKKLESGDALSTDLKEEESSIVSNYKTILIDSLIESRQLLTKTIKLSLFWLNTSYQKTNENLLLSLNQEYIKNIVEINSKKYLIKHPIQINYKF